MVRDDVRHRVHCPAAIEQHLQAMPTNVLNPRKLDNILISNYNVCTVTVF